MGSRAVRLDATPGDTGSPSHLLVVDDVKDNRDVLRRRLKRRGFQVTCACDGSSALALIEDTRFSIVLLDVMMPGMSGPEVLKRVRKSSRERMLPIIMLTAVDDSRVIADCLRQGADDYVTKPFDFDVLEARINAQVERARQTRQLQNSQEAMKDRMAAMDKSLLEGEFLDDLTGLFTEKAFELQVARRLVQLKTAPSPVYLLMLSLDQSALMRDVLGKKESDRILLAVSNLLRETLPETSCIGRAGFDEFYAIVVEGGKEKAAEVAEKLLQAIREMDHPEGKSTIALTASIGLTLLETTETSPGEPLLHLSHARDIAREQGGNSAYSSGSRDQKVLEKSQNARWAVKIHSALEKDAFLLMAQPIVPTGKNITATKVKYEVLIRMLENDRIVSPNQFLRVAEQHGLSVEIDRWVLANTLEQVAQSDPTLIQEIGAISINVSGPSLTNPLFLEQSSELLQSASLPSGKLLFEITETAAISNLEKARTFIRRISELGVEFALDDFGSGMSSFGYLRELPVDYVKIDGKFVQEIETSPVNRAIVSAINNVAQILGKKTIAEYVGTDEAKLELERIGVDYLQGFLFGKPVPLDDIFVGAASHRESRERWK